MELAMSRIATFAVAISLALPGVGAVAQTKVSDAWVRATVPQQKASGLYASITSVAGARLLAASSPVAAMVEIHEMRMDGNVMRMRALSDGLVLPAGKAVELKPGGYHVMMMGLKQQLNVGDSVAVTLTFEGPDKKRETLELKVPVRVAQHEPAHKH